MAVNDKCNRLNIVFLCSNTLNKLRIWFSMKTSYCKHWGLTLPLIIPTHMLSGVVNWLKVYRLCLKTHSLPDILNLPFVKSIARTLKRLERYELAREV